MKQPLVSIILPTYNGEAFIAESIDSILRQSYTDFELIIVDDCSTDKTTEIIASFTDQRIKVIRNNVNLNLPSSLNIGHSVSCGKYLTWTSDDNILKSAFLSELVASLIETHSDIAYSNFEVIDENNKFLRLEKIKPLYYVIFGNPVGASFLYTREVFERLHYREDLQGIEDYNFWIRASDNFTFTMLDKILYKYRKHSNTLTSQISNSDVLRKNHLNKLEIALSDFVSFSNESKKILYGFQNRDVWNWGFYFQYRKSFLNEIKNWLSDKGYGCSYSEIRFEYLRHLRDLCFQESRSDFRIRAILEEPGILFHPDFSVFRTLKFLCKAVFSKKNM